MVELECYGLVEEKHFISPQQLNRLFEQTNCLSVPVVNFQRRRLPYKLRPTQLSIFQIPKDVGLGSMLSKKSPFSWSFVATVGAIGFDLVRPGR